MADFTSAAQFVGRPQVQLEDPMQAQMKAASLAQAMQQQQLGALQLGEAKRAAENRDYIQTAIQQGMDPYQAMMNRGMVKEAKDFQIANWNQQKAAHDAQKSALELVIQKTARLAQITSGVKDQPTFDKALAQAKSEGYNIENINPVYNPDTVQQFQNESLSTKDRAELTLKKLELEHKQQMEQWGQPVASLNKQTGKPAFFQRNAKTGEVKEVPGFIPQPNQNIINLNNMSTPGVAKTFETDAARPWRENSTFKTLSGQNGALAADVDAALNNDYKFGSNRNFQYDREVEKNARAINPNWRRGLYDIKQKLIAAPEIDASNATLRHLNDFVTDYEKLSNATKMRLLNTPINKWIGLVRSDSPDAALLASLTTTGKSLGAEYGRALHVSNAQKAEEARESLFDPGQTRGQITGVTGAVAKLIKQVVNAKEYTPLRSDPNSQPFTLLDPQAVDTLRRLKIPYSPGGKGESITTGKAGIPGKAAPGSAVSLDDYLKSKGF